MQVEEKEILLSKFNDLIELLMTIENIIKIIKESCFYKEMFATYYSYQNNTNKQLSEERNLYINMLNIAIEKIAVLKEINNNIEKVFYNL
ncbi:hypothetical protein J6R97_01545 [bacterium]|nr:hypothetical protein [bacterium]